MRTARLIFLIFVALLTGCANLAPRPAVPVTLALSDVADTRLAKIAAAAVPPNTPGISGFRLLPEGETAFNARIALARRAQKSIDAQYYLINNDDVGQQFLRELRDAALRGVRVRLMVDDLYAAQEDPLLLGLASYPNVEVRIFNPLPSRGGSFNRRLLFSLHEFTRINHRMHNKLFVADNSFAVSGGRNIANEYFMHSAEANFIDLDVMSCGQVVREFSAAFDNYWNSEHVYPIENIADPVPPEDARRRFDEIVRDASPNLPERPLDVLGHGAVSAQLDGGRLSLHYGKGQVLFDSPDKVDANVHTRGPATVTERTLALFARATTEVRISSPYFIPGERGMAIMRAVGATEENGRITLVTNSQASTDEPMAWAGYARYRLDMLKAGVRIYELGPSLSRESGAVGNFGRSQPRLHAKASVIDHRLVFVGSMNLDARSARANTEIGLVIDSAEAAEEVTGLFRFGLSLGSYKLRLAPDGQHIEWVATDAQGRQTVYDKEPEDSAWLRFKVWLLSPFVSDELL